MLAVMAAPDAGTPATGRATAAIEEFGRRLGDRGLSATTRRIRVHFLREYLRHALASWDAGDADGPPPEVPVKAEEVTAGELMAPERASAWLADAAVGKTRTRGTSRGREAAAYPNSMRVRADTWNGFAEFLGLPDRLAPAKPADGFRLPPEEAEQLVHDLAVRRPVTANAITALRTAAVAALVADTGRGVPELAGLTVDALHLSGGSPAVKMGDESFRLGAEAVSTVSRWLSARAALIAEPRGQRPRLPVDPRQARPPPRRRPARQARPRPGRRPHPAPRPPRVRVADARHALAPRHAARPPRRRRPPRRI